MQATRYRKTVGRETDLCPGLVDREKVEVRVWARFAKASHGPELSFVAGCEDHRLCRLHFTVIAKDRKGCPRVYMCTSKSVGRQSAVLICRKPLEIFSEVQVQLDDEVDRPWVRAKVVDNAQTIGGYAVRVEFLVEARNVA